MAVERDSTRRTYLDAMLTHRAVVIFDSVGAVLVESVGVMVARLDAFFAVDAFFSAPNKTALQRMDLVARAVGDAAHRNIFTGAAEAAGPMSLNVGKVDKKIRVMDEARNVDMTKLL